MTTLLRSFIGVGMLLLLMAQVARAGDYTDSSGYSFTYPEGWVAINRAKLGDVNKAVPAEIKGWVERNKIDLNRISVVLLRDGRDAFLENMNVIVEGQQLPAEEAAAKMLTEVMAKQFAAIGAKVEGMKASVQKVGANPAIVIEYQIKLPGVPDQLQQKQAMIPGGGRTYIVTCTAKATTFAKHAETFDKILASFKIPAPEKE